MSKYARRTDGVIERAETRGQPEPLGGGESELGVENDTRRGELGRGDDDLRAFLIRVPSTDLYARYAQRRCIVRSRRTTCRVLRCAQSGGDGDLPEERPARLLVEEVEDRLGRVDGRAAPDADDDVRAAFFEDLHTLLDVGDGGMLADLEECGGVGTVFFEDVFYDPDDVCLCCRDQQEKICVGSSGRLNEYFVVKGASSDDQCLLTTDAVKEFVQSSFGAAWAVVYALECVGVCVGADEICCGGHDGGGVDELNIVAGDAEHLKTTRR